MVEVNIFIDFIVCTYLDMTSILFLTCFCSEKFQSGIFFIFGIIFLYNDNLNAIIGMF